jgi:hypothetical protein
MSMIDYENVRCYVCRTPTGILAACLVSSLQGAKLLVSRLSFGAPTVGAIRVRPSNYNHPKFCLPS